MTSISEGSTLGDRYVLLETIASGGMGDVWKATDLRLSRDVAVKVLRGEFGHDEITGERFRFEAQAAASLTSSGIATVFDYGEERSDQGGHRAYIVMELVHGESLDERVRRKGSLDVQQTLEIIGQAAVALQAAHDRGLVHRDIKPANLLLRVDGVVKLTDFGIARALDGSTLTQQGTMVGTVRYMSPEQLSGQAATPASDLYALGIVTYFCLAGHTPFDYQESMAIALAHVHDPLPPMPDGVPGDVAVFVAQMLAKDPSQRPTSAGVVASEAAALKKAAVPFPARSSAVNDPVSASDTAGDMTRFSLPLSPGSADQADGPTVSDRRPTMVMAAPIPTDPQDRRVGPQRHRRWLMFSVLMAALAVVLAFWLSAGADRVTVPRVQGLTVAVAEARVDHVGLHAHQHLVNVDQRAGQVTAQTPRAGSSVTKGSYLRLDVASGFVTVDATALLGQTSERSAVVLTSLGMHPEQAAVVSSAAPGTVVSISPSGRVSLGTTVVMGVAVAPPPPTTTTTTTTTTAAQPPPTHKKPAKGQDH